MIAMRTTHISMPQTYDELWYSSLTNQLVLVTMKAKNGLLLFRYTYEDNEFVSGYDPIEVGYLTLIDEEF
jgi:hypothetical protein